MFLDLYAPPVSGLLFGRSGSSNDRVIREIIDEIQFSERILLERLDEILDEDQDQIESELDAGFFASVSGIEIWLLSDNLELRYDTRESLLEAVDALAETQVRILSYIEDVAGSERSQLRRLQLLPIQLAAAQMQLSPGSITTASARWRSPIAIHRPRCP